MLCISSAGARICIFDSFLRLYECGASLAASSKVTQAKGWNEDNDVVHSDEKVLRLHMQRKASDGKEL